MRRPGSVWPEGFLAGGVQARCRRCTWQGRRIRRACPRFCSTVRQWQASVRGKCVRKPFCFIALFSLWQGSFFSSLFGMWAIAGCLYASNAPSIVLSRVVGSSALNTFSRCGVQYQPSRRTYRTSLAETNISLALILRHASGLCFDTCTRLVVAKKLSRAVASSAGEGEERGMRRAAAAAGLEWDSDIGQR